MSATQELIAAALALAALAERNTDDRDEWQHAIDSVREACARAMVQPDIAEVERLVSEHEYKLECYHSGIVWAGETKATRTALLDYVRGVMAERDALIHDNERSIHGDAHEAVGYARGKLEAVPSGYWLAPVEPTPEMKSAGLHVEVGENNHVLTWTEVAAIYREMRDAALRGEVKP